jgi:hypothetical protein
MILMANFPTVLDNVVDEVTDIMAMHINNLQSKIGVDGSAVTTSLDYLLKNSASVDPGHYHSGASIQAGAIALSNMANLAASSIIGNNTGSPATPLALSASQVKSLLAIAQADVSGLTTSSIPTFAGLTLSSGSITSGSIITLSATYSNVTGQIEASYTSVRFYPTSDNSNIVMAGLDQIFGMGSYHKYGLTGHAYYCQNQGSGSVSAVYCLDIWIQNSGGGTITSAVGLWIENPSNSSGTITNTYGIYINSQASGTQTNNPYAIYQAGSSDYNYFAGNVGIGNTTPSTYLLTMESTGGGYYNQSTHAWVNGSSMRWKDNVTPITGALELVKNLSGKRFNWKLGGHPGIGLIAEDVHKVIPEVADVDLKDPNFCTGVNYGALVGLLVEAIKEQQVQIDALQARLN